MKDLHTEQVWQSETGTRWRIIAIDGEYVTVRSSESYDDTYRWHRNSFATMKLLTRRDALRGFCKCEGCLPATAVARGNAAIRMVRAGRFGRPFEHCFECADDDDVVRHITRICAADPALTAKILKAGYGSWLDPEQYSWLWTEAEPHPFTQAQPVA